VIRFCKLFKEDIYIFFLPWERGIAGPKGIWVQCMAGSKTIGDRLFWLLAG